MSSRKKPQDTNTHHRLPRSRGGGNDVDNLIQVNVTKHRAWHTLFQNYTPEQIAEIITRTWIPKGCQMVVQRKEHTPDEKPPEPVSDSHEEDEVSYITVRF